MWRAYNFYELVAVKCANNCPILSNEDTDAIINSEGNNEKHSKEALIG